MSVLQLKVWLPSVQFISVANKYVLDTAGVPPIPPHNSSGSSVIDNPLYSNREKTVATLWEQLQRVRVIHARGTPTSGKSILARLLKKHVERVRPDMQVHLFNWPANTKGFEYSNYYYLLNEITGEPKTVSDTWLERKNTLVIIDEAQRSYEFLNLWDQFIKPLASQDVNGPWVILFSSFGSPTETLVASCGGSAPVEFDTTQRVSIRPLSFTNPNVSLYFTRDEFEDVLARVCKCYSEEEGNLFSLSPKLVHNIWEITNGHPGAVRVVLDMLAHSEVSIG